MLRLEQMIQFQQDLLLKQHELLTRQQVITEKRIAAVTAPGVPAAPPAAAATCLNRVASRPLGAWYFSGGLLLLIMGTTPYVTGHNHPLKETETSRIRRMKAPKQGLYVSSLQQQRLRGFGRSGLRGSWHLDRATYPQSPNPLKGRREGTLFPGRKPG